MKQLLCITFSLIVAMTQASAKDVLPAPNGITLPDYQDWRVISQSHRTDNNSVRIILGNDIAIDAARAGKTKPWPDGTILAKLVWKQRIDDAWPAAVVPGDFVHAEFMIKDARKYKDTAGWGFARWLGLEEKPYGKDAGFVQECVACHTPVKEKDYVYTRPVILPGRE